MLLALSSFTTCYSERVAAHNYNREIIEAMRRQLLEWFALHRRDLPWRRNRDPYAIWVSEVMLQQTRVAAVVDRYQAFLQKFPSLLALALAPEEAVLAEWSGLGYYRRARMLHKTARLLADRQQGNLPIKASELRLLPGIGAYTAAAIASIAHNERVAVVDGNVERVILRLQGWEEADRKGGSSAVRRKVENFADEFVDPAEPGEFNQALMELGALICLPRNPACNECPLLNECVTRGEHKTQPRPPMQSREVAHALSVRIGQSDCPSSREVLLEQRPASLTVMPGLWELPLLRESAVPEAELRLTVRHSILQINYYVRIRTVFEDDVAAIAIFGGERRWVPLSEAATMPLTGLTRKVLKRTHLFLIPSPAAHPQRQPDNGD